MTVHNVIEAALSVPMPDRIRALKKDVRGLPIPYTVYIGDDGSPDFRVICPDKSSRAIKMRCCAICGQTLGARMAFVGGPGSLESRCFTDLPMHRDCAEYALRTCPFLAAPKFAYRRSVPEGLHVNEAVSTKRPDRFGLGICKGYALANFSGETVIRAEPFESIEWWALGRPIAEGKEE